MITILLVEDSTFDRVLVEGLLKNHEDVRVVSVKSGVEALASMSDVRPDVVITDMQMPEMNGLQLVTTLRIEHPQVPVVLITAHGSEQLALEALEHGASSYVPKSQLKDTLLDAVRHVTAIAHADRGYERLTQSMESAELRFRLAYDLHVFERLVELLGQMAVSLGVCALGEQIRLGMAVDEALQYLFLRGNYELNDDQLQHVYMHDEAGLTLLTKRQRIAPYQDRKILVECRLTAQQVEVTITHEGPAMTTPGQFNHDSPELESASQRSLVMMSTFLDGFHFSPDGRVLTLTKNKTA